MSDQILFFYFFSMILAGALVAIASPSMIYSALALLIAFIHTAGIYILLNAEFIAAVQIIVYAGAILVLYLFVLMLFNPKQEKVYWHKQYPVGIILGLSLVALLLFAINRPHVQGQQGDFTESTQSATGNTQAIGQALFSDYIFPFEISSLILLVAMLGAIILAGRGTKPEKS